MKQYHDYISDNSFRMGKEIDGYYRVKKIKIEGNVLHPQVRYIKRGTKIYRNPNNKEMQNKI